MNLQEKAKDLFDSAKEPAFEMGCELFLDGVVGVVAPGIVTTYLSYKQKRQEKMYEKFMVETKEKFKLLENRLNCLTREQYVEFKEKYFGLVSDYILEEVQEEKIEYLANGFINIASIPDVTEDFILTYYDVLKELRITDIGVLKFYGELKYLTMDRRTYVDVLEELSIEYEQYEAIREKLLRLGLLTTKREKNLDDLYENILSIQSFLENVSKNKKTNLKSFKKIDKKDSFEISKFGKEFIIFFMTIEE